MTIKILQWNVFYKEDPSNLVELIKKIDPDIVCAQEMIQYSGKESSGDTSLYIAEKLNYKYRYFIGDTWSDNKEKDNQGNAIFSKFTIQNSFHFPLQIAKHNPPDAEHEGRVYVEITIKVGEKTLTIGTTHLSYSHMFKITEHRKKEINNLLSILNKRKNNFIFTGDLNSTPESFTIKEINKIDHLNNIGPDMCEKTWTTKPFEYEGFKESDLNWRLDYAFATKDIQVNNAKIVSTNFSDHLPILLEIEI